MDEYYFTTNDPVPNLCAHFNNTKCSSCGKKYNYQWSMSLDSGIPLYYRWAENRPLTNSELVNAIQGTLKINWFCSPECSSHGVNPLLII